VGGERRRNRRKVRFRRTMFVVFHVIKKTMSLGEVGNSPPRRGMGNRCTGWFQDWGQ
jgi:hypothetical protein